MTGEANWPFAPLIDLQVWCRKCPNTQSKVVLPAIPLVLRITSAVLWIFCSSLPFRCGSFNAILGVGLQLPHLFSSGGTTAFTLHSFFLRSYTVLQPNHVLRECKTTCSAQSRGAVCRRSRHVGAVMSWLGKAWLCLHSCMKVVPAFCSWYFFC